MELERARRVVETTSPETVNQYLRFGWKLVNQHHVEARDGLPARTNYILASFRSLEDTRQVLTLEDAAAVNEYLQLGWRLIDKYVRQSSMEGPRDETLHFVLAWTGDEPPVLLGMTAATPALTDPSMFDSLGDFKNLPPIDDSAFMPPRRS
jgi:hypothetical protein